MDNKHWKKVEITKIGNEKMGMKLVPTGRDAVVPGVVVEQIHLNGPAHKTGKIAIGDQIMSINGASLIGMKFSDITDLISGVNKGVRIIIELVEGGASNA